MTYLNLHVQKKALGIIFPGNSYQDARRGTLSSRRIDACKTFASYCKDSKILNNLFRKPVVNVHSYNLRSGQSNHLPAL